MPMAADLRRKVAMDGVDQGAGWATRLPRDCGMRIPVRWAGLQEKSGVWWRSVSGWWVWLRRRSQPWSNAARCIVWGERRCGSQGDGWAMDA